MTKKELLPCPFCGKKPIVSPQEPSIEGDAWTRIRCRTTDCPAEDGIIVYQDIGHFDAAAKIWNMRKYDGRKLSSKAR